MKKLILLSALTAAGVAALALAGAPAALSDQIQEVLVRNFPEIQEVKGSVAVNGTIAHSEFFRREGIVVPPARRTESTNLTAAGTIETGGFTGVVLSLAGEVKDTVFNPGNVGAVLVPDEEPVLRALTEIGRIEFPVEVVATVDPQKTSFFASEPTPRPVAFPRYRLYLYNSSNKSVEANLYVYLTN